MSNHHWNVISADKCLRNDATELFDYYVNGRENLDSKKLFHKVH